MKEATKKNHFKILEILPTINREEINKAYKALAKTTHPDIFQQKNPSASKEQITQLGEIFAIISDACDKLLDMSDSELNKYVDALIKPSNPPTIAKTATNTEKFSATDFQPVPIKLKDFEYTSDKKFIIAYLPVYIYRNSKQKETDEFNKNLCISEDDLCTYNFTILIENIQKLFNSTMNHNSFKLYPQNIRFHFSKPFTAIYMVKLTLEPTNDIVVKDDSYHLVKPFVKAQIVEMIQSNGRGPQKISNKNIKTEDLPYIQKILNFINNPKNLAKINADSSAGVQAMKEIRQWCENILSHGPYETDYQTFKKITYEIWCKVHYQFLLATILTPTLLAKNFFYSTLYQNDSFENMTDRLQILEASTQHNEESDVPSPH